MAQPNMKRLFPSMPLTLLALSILAWLLLWSARLAVLTIPLRQLVRFFGEDHGVDPAVPLVSEKALGRAQGIRKAIEYAVRYSPKSANCYPQALVARLLLKARGIPHALFFGLRRNPDTGAMDAHAWVMAGPLPVTGGHSFGDYTVVRSFLNAAS